MTVTLEAIKEIDSAPWLADPSATVQDIVEQDEFSKSVFKLLDELPDVYRTILPYGSQTDTTSLCLIS
jgi:hypothetical protein